MNITQPVKVGITIAGRVVRAVAEKVAVPRGAAPLPAVNEFSPYAVIRQIVSKDLRLLSEIPILEAGYGIAAVVAVPVTVADPETEIPVIVVSAASQQIKC